jgi:hypothetical protein
MKTLMLMIAAGSVLAGCAIVPVPVGPGVYVGVPVPAISVRPWGYDHRVDGREGYGDPRYRRGY